MASDREMTAAKVGLLVCGVGSLTVAVPLSNVIGVTECVPVTSLPFAPRNLDGLVLAMGYSIVQMTLGNILGGSCDGRGVLVVAKVDDDVRALKVDSVEAMVEVDAPMLRPADGESDSPLSHRCDWNGRTVAVVDMRRLWEEGDFGPETDGGTGAVALARVDTTTPRPPQQTDLEPFLLIEAGGERYALHSDDVMEIMVVDTVRPMPGAPAWLAGLIDRRGTPTLAISTRSLLGHQEASAGGLALVVPHARRGPVALLFDRALGIRYYAPGDVHAIIERIAGIESYLVAEDGRIVGMIGAAALLGPIAARLTDLTPAPTEDIIGVPPAAAAEVVRMLTLGVGEDDYAIALDRVERIQAAVTMTPLPAGGNGFDGLVDAGDATVPVIDLRARREGTGLAARPPCILVRLDGATAGLVVDRVLQIKSVPRDRIDPVVPHERLPVSGVFATDGRMTAVLMIDRLLPLLPA